jgi:hypothetical protein
MNNWDDSDEGWSDEDSLHDYPDDSNDSAETVVCNACGRDVYEEASQCPYCGEFLTASTSAWDGRPGWWGAVGFVGIVAVILVLLGLAI